MTALVIRGEVMAFAAAIELTLQRNETEKGKGDTWKDCPILQLHDKLDEEYVETLEALLGAKEGLDNPDVCHELVDLATVSMFLWNRYGIGDKDEVES